MKEGGPGSRTKAQIQERYDMFQRTGHYPDCVKLGCDRSGCAAARFVTRWNEWGRP